MEINSAIDLTQDHLKVEQYVDSTENNNELTELSFKQILAKERAPQEELFKMPSNELPITGNELPLDLVTSTQLPLFEDLEQPSTEAIIEKEESKELPFLMTHLMIDRPYQLSEVTSKAFPFSSSFLLSEEEMKPLTLAQNESLSNQQLLQPSDLSSIAYEVLQPGLLVKQQNGQDNEMKLVLKESIRFDETFQAIKGTSDEPQYTADNVTVLPEGLQNALAQSSNSKISESMNELFKKPNPEIEASSEQRSQPLVNEFYAIKEPFKQTMVLPTNNSQSEHFSDVFENKLMENVTLMVRRNENVAEIQIDPPELGRIDITIDRSDEKTDIRFMTQVDQTRQLIEGSLDKLKWQLAENGIELGQVDVNSGQQEQSSNEMKQARASYPVGSSVDSIMVAPAILTQSNQLLDLYI